MVKIIGRYGRHADNVDMLNFLGVTRLPKEGLPVQMIQGVQVYVKPLEPRTDGYKSSKHRIFAICNCGVHVPAGRLHQHKCHERETMVVDKITRGNYIKARQLGMDIRESDKCPHGLKKTMGCTQCISDAMRKQQLIKELRLAVSRNPGMLTDGSLSEEVIQQIQ